MRHRSNIRSLVQGFGVRVWIAAGQTTCRDCKHTVIGALLKSIYRIEALKKPYNYTLNSPPVVSFKQGGSASVLE